MEQQVKAQRPGYHFDNRATARNTGSWYNSKTSTNKVQQTTPHEKEYIMYYKATLPKEAPPYKSAWHMLSTASLKQFSESPNVSTEYTDNRNIVSMTVNEHDGVFFSVYRRLAHKRNPNFETQVWECILAKKTDHNKKLLSYWNIARDEQLYFCIDTEMAQKKKSRST